MFQFFLTSRIRSFFLPFLFSPTDKELNSQEISIISALWNHFLITASYHYYYLTIVAFMLTLNSPFIWNIWKILARPRKISVSTNLNERGTTQFLHHISEAISSTSNMRRLATLHNLWAFISTSFCSIFVPSHYVFLATKLAFAAC